MKTAIDAVNELKGDYNCKDASNTCDQIIVAMKNFHGYSVGDIEVGSGNRYDGRGSWRAICTFNEFLATVAECETNFGQCDPINVSHYKLAGKVLLTKDLDKELDVDIWKNAPEGATHLSKESNEEVGCWIKQNQSNKLFYITVEYHEIKRNNEPDSWIPTEDFDIKDLTPKPQPTPIFTQEMADNGVLPSVGMECRAITNTVTIGYVGNNFLVLVFPDGSDGTITHKEALEDLKPLTPPITLIDGKAYQFECGSNTRLGFFNGKGFVGGVHSYWELSACTNIQPLTVEVK
jgi:hypothetical protein